MTSQTRLNKNNAQKAQKLVCKHIKEKFPGLVVGTPKSDLSTCDLHPRQMGQSGTDIIMNRIAEETLQTSIEVKYGKGWQKLVDALDQARKNCSMMTYPIVVINPAGTSRLIVALEYEVFLDLHEELRQLKRLLEQSDGWV